ncbi:outer membrane beta-barrel protein [Flavobacterium wongokense]|uniref:outer membrane beta-barrel protein n=1 Tax=Flavobacterium wongokense TaxID=2910674 RepID=UPI001F3F3725|nr:outer membrane beta-barrel protein [Flavobacterium sp. WG47]MCF6132393.1 porin family protein [Flavobacterium sp. WG47]
MKFKFLYAFLLLSALSFAQTTKFAIEAAYPLPIDNNFLGDHFKGVADLGIKYRIKNLQVINIGVSVNGSMFTYSDSYFFAELPEMNFKTTLYMIQPRAYVEINLKKIIKIHPYAGIGYSFLRAKQDFDNDVYDKNTSQSGMNVTFGLSYDIISKLYIFANYDYISLTELDSDVPKTSYNTNASLVKVGLGLRL